MLYHMLRLSLTNVLVKTKNRNESISGEFANAKYNCNKNHSLSVVTDFMSIHSFLTFAPEEVWLFD